MLFFSNTSCSRLFSGSHVLITIPRLLVIYNYRGFPFFLRFRPYFLGLSLWSRISISRGTMNPSELLFYYYKSFCIISSRASVSQVLKTTVIALCNCLSIVNLFSLALDPLYPPLPRSDVDPHKDTPPATRPNGIVSNHGNEADPNLRKGSVTK